MLGAKVDVWVDVSNNPARGLNNFLNLTVQDGGGTPLANASYLICPLGTNGTVGGVGTALIPLPPGTYTVKAADSGETVQGEQAGVVIEEGNTTPITLNIFDPFTGLSC